MNTNQVDQSQRKTSYDLKAFDFSSELQKATEIADLWKVQIEKRQNDSDRAYARRHSLEMTLGRKFFDSNQDDRSIVGHNAA